MKILITGATGFIGSFLTGLLVARGDRVSIVSRDPEHVRNARSNCTVVGWLPDLSGYDAVVNLAGESLFGKRWSPEQRALIHDSRQSATERLVAALKEASPRPPVLVSASAVGIYGDRKDEVLGELDALGSDFLAQVCRDWEAAAMAAEEFGVRTTLVRIGVVLGHGGALEKMLPPFKSGLGGPIGSGRQWLSWIHIRDLCRLILRAVDDDSMRGAYNGCAPTPVTSREFARCLGRALHRPAFIPAPAFILKLVLGDVAQLLTDSQRCSAERVLATGFEFEFGELEPALCKLLR